MMHVSLLSENEFVTSNECQLLNIQLQHVVESARHEFSPPPDIRIQSGGFLASYVMRLTCGARRQPVSWSYLHGRNCR
jgi:hypothetical protein